METRPTIGGSITDLFIFAILALGLNVAVGYAGLLHLGIAAFFGIGAYIIGILTVGGYPFQLSFTAALVLATVGAGLAGLGSRRADDPAARRLSGAGDARLRRSGECRAEESRKHHRRHENAEPAAAAGRARVADAPARIKSIDFRSDYRPFYFLALAILAGVVLLLRNLENSRLGRAWVAIREDELAATCLGINATRVKLSAFALSAALAGLAGGLFATKLASTSDPHTYSFNLSITVLCCLILGGLGSIRGVLLGVLLLKGYEIMLVPQLDALGPCAALVADAQAMEPADVRPRADPDGPLPSRGSLAVAAHSTRIACRSIRKQGTKRFAVVDSPGRPATVALMACAASAFPELGRAAHPTP